MALHVGSAGAVSAKSFRPGRPFAGRSPLTALACAACGHVMPFLLDRGILVQDK
ncbi:hypothetical protein [Streptomyces sp. NPDC048361]|uniref:hypothetical protein n=1 Tax=Streptomyces sp. NPDC048361 TaxID=3154720 RepID=UPI00342F832A